ncbi:MAG: glycosyltransferase family 2 protein [Lachnospiraceae bacterium]|nr:glycosyltransferase family 2 protein [Lachnospiraceae bacterium]
MAKVTVVIPNYNGINFIENCLSSLMDQTFPDFDICVVDNASTDGSAELIGEKFPEVLLIRNTENYGFAKAVNQGIRQSTSGYVILLNNDTVTDRDFVRALYEAIRKDGRVFAYQAKMLNLYDRTKTDSAGDLYCALGWAFAPGKDKDAARFSKDVKIFSACAGAAIYNKELLRKTGYFDEKHISYLEDVDICYRARIEGYVCRFAPKALVYHAGSGVTGSRHNPFKVRLSSRNSVYLIYKNMPVLQLLLNLPLLLAGYLIKILFFTLKGMGKDYLSGLCEGMKLCASGRKYPFKPENLKNYVLIQLELWINVIRRITG